MKNKLVSFFWGYMLPETKKAWKAGREQRASELYAKARAKSPGPHTPSRGAKLLNELPCTLIEDMGEGDVLGVVVQKADSKKVFKLFYQEVDEIKQWVKSKKRKNTDVSTGLVEIVMEVPGKTKPTVYMLSPDEFQELKEFLCGNAVQ